MILPQTTIGLVYFIVQTAPITHEQYVKIGFTTNLERRILELKIGNPCFLEPAYIIPDVSFSFETHVQQVCEGFHTEGEWFHIEVLQFLLERSSPWFREHMAKMRITKKDNWESIRDSGYINFEKGIQHDSITNHMSKI
jgi:hypothetical protein